jgi:hypothetical protein
MVWVHLEAAVELLGRFSAPLRNTAAAAAAAAAAQNNTQWCDSLCMPQAASLTAHYRHSNPLHLRSTADRLTKQAQRIARSFLGSPTAAPLPPLLRFLGFLLTFTVIQQLAD